MKLNFLKKAVFLAVVVSACYLMNPQQVDADWDFNRGTGNWMVDEDAREAWCEGSWWNNECRGTRGVVHF